MARKQQVKGGCRELALVGVPFDLAANMAGARYGPNRIRKYLLPALKKRKIPFRDYGDVPVPERPKKTNKKQKYVFQVKQVCQHFGLKKAFFKACLPVVLGGDHSIVFCLVRELTKNRKLGLIWFDAHGDFNTIETSPSGNVHGMVLASIDGRTLQNAFELEKSLVKEHNIAMVGQRDLDFLEEKLLDQSRITLIRMKQVRKTGLGKAVKRAIRIASASMQGIHVSFDIDCIDPSAAPGVSTPVKGGFSRAQALKTMRLLKASGKLHSIDFVEYNPKQDKQDRTAKLIAQMIQELA